MNTKQCFDVCVCVCVAVHQSAALEIIRLQTYYIVWIMYSDAAHLHCRRNDTSILHHKVQNQLTTRNSKRKILRCISAMPWPGFIQRFKPGDSLPHLLEKPFWLVSQKEISVCVEIPRKNEKTSNWDLDGDSWRVRTTEGFLLWTWAFVLVLLLFDFKDHAEIQSELHTDKCAMWFESSSVKVIAIQPISPCCWKCWSEEN